MEGALSISIPSVLDLSIVDEHERANVWRTTTPGLMPGLSIRKFPYVPALGQIRRISFGGGWLWHIRSAPVLVRYAPSGRLPEDAPTFSLLMQLDGSLIAGQTKRECELKAGDLCLIDGFHSFELAGEQDTEIIVLQMPRKAVLSRHPHLEHRTASRFESHGPGTTLLRNMMLNMAQAAPFLAEDQRGSALTGILQLLGLPEMPRPAELAEVNWRARAALAYIETRFADTTLTAGHVAAAQVISRRRLDQIFREAVGMSLTAQIWQRRLVQAAQYLADPQHARQTVAQIGYATGFEAPSHFTRAFKRHYGRTPSEWREMGGASAR